MNAHGEVADFVDVSQFIPGRSAYECVAYSAALCYYAGLPGHGPTGTALQASNLAQYWYGREEGSNLASNTNGMSVEAMYNMLQGMGLEYSPIVASLAQVKIAIAGGLPVMLCGAETGMYDVLLGDRVPYSWTPTGNHCIVVSGVRDDGNLLVHDCASINSSGVRPGPRVYDASKLQIVSATAVHLKGELMSGIPQGWHMSGDGVALICPSSVQGGPEVEIKGRIMAYVLANNWDYRNVALAPSEHKDQLELSNTSLGSGWQQTFRYAMLGIPDTGPHAGVVIWEWLGQELAEVRILLAKANEEVAQLKAQPAGLDAAKVQERLKQIETLAAQPIV